MNNHKINSENRPPNSTSPKSTICFVAAHSGGHMIPCATLAAKLTPAHKILFISIDQKLERDILAKFNFIDQIKFIALPKFPYKKIWLYPNFIYKLIKTILNSREILRSQQVTRVITTGGISAIPVCFSAKILGIPIELYELNLEPGKTITFLAPLAAKIKICFAETRNFFRATEQQKCELVNYPVRFTEQDRNLSGETFFNLISKELPKKTNLETFSLSRKTIFILGGSQGSTYLNNLADKLLPLAAQIQIIHQTGTSHTPISSPSSTSSEQINSEPLKPISNITQWEQFYAQHNIPAYVFTYTHEIAQLYQLADLIITRAGAGVLAEILFFHKPAIVIPLKTGTTNHQVANALALAAQHPELFTVLDQDQVTQDPQNLLTAITKLFVQS